MAKPPADPADRFWPKVQVGLDDECWPWLGYRARHGYGRFYFGGRAVHAHRVSYILAHPDEDIDGLDVDHLCHNPPCVNPTHLEAVTHAENMRRTAMALSPTCARGHEFTGYRNSSTGRRECIECIRARDRRKTERRRERRRAERAAAGWGEGL